MIRKSYGFLELFLPASSNQIKNSLLQKAKFVFEDNWRF